MKTQFEKEVIQKVEGLSEFDIDAAIENDVMCAISLLSMIKDDQEVMDLVKRKLKEFKASYLEKVRLAEEAAELEKLNADPQ